jgi:poly-gamma-glutamate synthesis protein (capsule biosynthesis protein)
MGTALVAYGLGNFVFYASREDNTRTGVLEVTATGRRIDSYRWRPARIRSGRPVPVTGEERSRLLRDWNGLRGCTGLRK